MNHYNFNDLWNQRETCWLQPFAIVPGHKLVYERQRYQWGIVLALQGEHDRYKGGYVVGSWKALFSPWGSMLLYSGEPNRSNRCWLGGGNGGSLWEVNAMQEGFPKGFIVILMDDGLTDKASSDSSISLNMWWVKPILVFALTTEKNFWISTTSNSASVVAYCAKTESAKRLVTIIHRFEVCLMNVYNKRCVNIGFVENQRIWTVPANKNEVISAIPAFKLSKIAGCAGLPARIGH